VGEAKDEQCGPWPRRLIVRMGRTIYPAIVKSPVGWLVRRSPMERIKYRIIYTPAWRVLAILDLLAAVGVPAWLAGGWGVDALLGRQTRPHCDIDLVIGDDDPSYQQVAQILTREGFWFANTQYTPGIPIALCHIWRHDAGHKVEVLPVPLHEPPFAAGDDHAGGVGQAFAEGSIDGRPVPCLAAELQLQLHNGYSQRKVDTHDVGLLRTYLGLPEQATIA
jgi:lincosamide nucleotidyltransferase A/C/D/E